MSIRLFIVTHDEIGAALMSTAIKMFGHSPLRYKTLSVSEKCDPDACRQQARDCIDELDSGDGVLVLTDMYGSTPCNIASAVIEPGRVNVVAGISLPMLVRVFNYPHLDLEQSTHKAVSGGHDGIMLCHRDKC
jgi:PTS system mannose-specific IIA component